MRYPKVFIIILNWNGLKDTLECLASVDTLDYRNYDIIVVDNGSSDNSCAIMQERYPKVRILKNQNNLGFTGGNNVGIKHALAQGADYIWLLNNDTIVDQQCLKEIIAKAETDKYIGLISPIIHSYPDPDEIQFMGSYLNWEDISVSYLNSSNIELVEREDLCLWGTALMIKKELVETVGYLKEEYFAYWEDIEYSLRSMSAGYKNLICKSGKVFHKNKYTPMEVRNKNKYYHYFMARNRMLLGREYLKTTLQRLIFVIRYFASISDYVRRCSGLQIDACMDGAWQGLKGVGGPMTDTIKMPFLIKKILLLMSKNKPIFIGDLLTWNVKRLLNKSKVFFRY